MRLKNLLCTVFVFCLSVNPPAYALDAAAALTKLLLNVKTMQADFTQTVKTQGASTSAPPTTGQMALARPGRFRWHIRQPLAQLIIANGQRLWIYDEDLEQVTIRSLAHAAGLTPAFLLSANTLNLTKDFQVQSVVNPKALANNPIFLLLPKNPDDPFASIQLAFLNGSIREMRLEDRLGHTTFINFKNVRVGMPLADALFTFKRAATIEVIDETKKPS